MPDADQRAAGREVEQLLQSVEHGKKEEHQKAVARLGKRAQKRHAVQQQVAQENPAHPRAEEALAAMPTDPAQEVVPRRDGEKEQRHRQHGQEDAEASERLYRRFIKQEGQHGA